MMEDSETCDPHFVSTPTGISSAITLTTIAHLLSPKPDNSYGNICLFHKDKMNVEIPECLGASFFQSWSASLGGHHSS